MLQRIDSRRPARAGWMALAVLLALVAGAPVAPAQAEVPPPVCVITPQVTQLVAQSRPADWAGWVADLSGAREVRIDGQPARILTRYTPAMFSGQANAQAYAFVRQQLLLWYPAVQLEEHAYRFDGQTWKNLVLTLPGASRPDEVVILSAHLDSISEQPTLLAPGASDNASGAAALLEAARIYRTARFERTIRLIFFTGEEQGKVGSRVYVRDHDLQGVLGVLNLDMFGYDGDGDRCFELHVGTLPASAPLGRCFLAALQAVQPGLAVDTLDGYDLRFSDHASFWEAGVGALEVLENYSYNTSQNGCQGLRDRSPNYHRSTDTLDQLDLETGFAIQQTALAAGAALALPLESCFTAGPQLNAARSDGQVTLSWEPMPAAQAYRVYRSMDGCNGGWQLLTQTVDPGAVDYLADSQAGLSYRVEALRAAGGCASLPSACVSFSPRAGADFQAQ